MAFAAGLAPILTVASAVVGIGSAVIGTAATISANNYQRQVAERNRQLMLENAARAQTQAQEEQLAKDMETRALIGEQVAAQSASGLKLGGRSQMLTRKAARELGRMDAINVRRAGDVAAFNFRMMAEDETDKIKQLGAANGFALLSGFLNAGSFAINGLKSPAVQGLFGAAKPKTTYTSLIPGAGDSLKFAR